MSTPQTASIARRIDTLPPKVSYVQRCADRRLQMVQLFCAGTCFKKIAAKFDTRPDNVSYAVNKFMHEHGLSTHAQLGVWMRDNGALL